MSVDRGRWWPRMRCESCASIIGANYVIQLVVVRPSLLAGELRSQALVKMPNPRSVFVALEAAGYGFFSLMALFIGAVFAGARLESWIRRLFIATGVTGMVGAIGAAADQRILMLAGFGLPLLTFLIAVILVGIHFKRLGGSVPAMRRGGGAPQGGER